MKLNNRLIFLLILLAFQLQNINAMEQPTEPEKTKEEISLLLQTPTDIQNYIINSLIGPNVRAEKIDEGINAVRKLARTNKLFHRTINDSTFTRNLINTINQKLHISPIQAAIELRTRGAFDWLQPQTNLPEIKKEINLELIKAAYKNLINKVKFLLDLGADVNAKNQYGDTALYSAIIKNNKEIVELLLNQPGIDINIKSNDGRTALMEAASDEKRKDIVKLLLSKPNININAQDSHGQTALMMATSPGNLKIVELLFTNLPQINVNLQNKYGLTALMLAINFNHNEIAKLLLNQSNIDVNLYDNQRNTALALAIKNENKETTELLLNHPNININFNIDFIYGLQDVPALLALVKFGWEDAVKKALSKPNVDPNVQDLRSGVTPLILAVQRDNKEIVEELLKLPNINIKIKDKKGKTALDYAKDKPEIKKLIKDYKPGSIKKMVKKIKSLKQSKKEEKSD